MNKNDYKKSHISVLREILTEYLRLLNYVPTDIGDNFPTMQIIIILCLLSMALAVIFRKLKKMKMNLFSIFLQLRFISSSGALFFIDAKLSNIGTF